MEKNPYSTSALDKSQACYEILSLPMEQYTTSTHFKAKKSSQRISAAVLITKSRGTSNIKLGEHNSTQKMDNLGSSGSINKYTIHGP